MLSVRNFGLRKLWFALLALMVIIPTTAMAQVISATMVGTITDPGGSIMPGAQVTARNVETGLTRTVTSGDDGSYRIEFLPVGKYALEVTTAGFKKAYISDIVLQVADTARVDVSLTVGQVTETVTVTEAMPQINTSTSEIGRTIQSAEITTLPLVERNVYTLLDLTPGVQSNNNGVAAASTGTSSLILGFPEQRTLINGGTDGGTGSVNYFLDGGSNMTNLRNTGNILPNPDAIQEFRVQTNSYNAEYGRFASGIINVLTKSGTNDFHGSAFEFIRNTVFNANDWGSQLERPPFRRNQFGATLGGPIKRDKTFFFASYSGLRQTTSTFLSGAIVPTALERVGNFTAIDWQGKSGEIGVGGTTVLKAIQSNVSPATKVTFSKDGTGAAGADVGIVVVGETPYAEGRGDKDDLSLSADDLTAIRNMKQTGIPVVVVLLSGRPMIINDALTQCDSFVAAWLPGTEGHGITDVLFGDYRPTGKLSFTWPRSMTQIPINVGDSSYDPLFKYGFGLTF